MPVIPVSDGDFFTLFKGVTRLYQNPSSWEATAEFEKKMVAPAAISLFRHTAGETITLSREDLELISSGHPDRVDLAVKVRDLNYGIMTAGHILVYVLRLAKHMPRLASAATAMRILEWQYTTSECKWPASPTSIKNAWRKYRPIAHFMGAISFMPEEYDSLNRIFPVLVDASDENAYYVRTDPDIAAKILADKDQIPERIAHARAVILPRYFAYAEALRRAGEAHFASGQDVHGHSLLDPETSWRVPEGFTLPSVNLEFPPLSDAELKAAGQN